MTLKIIDPSNKHFPCSNRKTGRSSNGNCISCFVSCQTVIVSWFVLRIKFCKYKCDDVIAGMTDWPFKIYRSSGPEEQIKKRCVCGFVRDCSFQRKLVSFMFTYFYNYCKRFWKIRNLNFGKLLTNQHVRNFENWWWKYYKKTKQFMWKN